MSQNNDYHVSRLGTELSFATDPETVRSVRTTVEAIEEQLNDLITEPESVESVGLASEDEYNSLLDVYDEPRTESDSGPLVGMTFAVKDCIAVAHLEITCGVENFSCVPPTDAVVVERLLLAGADVVGKANMEPFAFGPTGEHSEYGPPINPIDANRVPGGSSSGSGVAVAAGLVDFALGTDTGGSVRLPAACCGIVGIKPTHGLVPRHGFVDLVPWTDTIGPLARSVETAATALDAMAGHDVRDPASSHVEIDSLTDGLNNFDGSELVIGTAESLFEASDDEVAEPVATAAEEVAAEFDVTIERVSVDLNEISTVYPLLVGDFGWLIRQHGVARGQGTGFDETLRMAIADYLENHEFNQYVTSRALPSIFLDAESNGRSYVAIRKKAIAFQQQLADIFTEVDVLLTPTTRILPPEFETIGVYENSLSVTGNTVPFSLAQTPAVTVPVDDVNGVPVSAQLVAPKFEDDVAIRSARLFEQLSTWP